MGKNYWPLLTIIPKGFLLIIRWGKAFSNALKRHLVAFFKLEAFNQELGGYWNTYGGLKAVFRSPFIYLASVFLVLTWPVVVAGSWEIPSFGILPALIGFSITAIAITLAFPSTSVFKFIAERGKENSLFLDLVARLVHFVIIQITALILCFLHNAYQNIFTSFIGYLFVLYAILTGVGIVLSLFGIAQIYNASAGIDSEP